MKFGKRVRALAHQEWEADYVDYKHLKQVVAQLATAPGNSHVNAFVEAAQTEMQRVNVAHARILYELAERDLPMLQRRLGSRWVLSTTQARALLLGVLDISERIDAFRRFVMLNTLAVIKITKKFSKVCSAQVAESDTNCDVRAVITDEMSRQPFYDGACMDDLCTRASRLTDRIMLCVLPDGNFRIDEPHVSCPICLQGEVKTAITLSCSHTFCWNCLSRASEHSFHSCPLCRHEQSIDPRDYAIDGLMKRFQRAYSFVEQGLDRAPFIASLMRPTLVEAFQVVNASVRRTEAQYAALSPRFSVRQAPSLSRTEPSDAIPCKTTKSIMTTVSDPEITPTPAFAKGEAIEVSCDGNWFPGTILGLNEDEMTYCVLWWTADSSQRCTQRMPRHRLRTAVYPDPDMDHHRVFVEAWKTATAWALRPFRSPSAP